MERGAVTKSQKGKKAYVEGKVGECFQWKSNAQCSKGDSCSFSHELAFVLREEGKFGSNYTVKFSKGTCHHVEIRESKGPSRGIIQKCEPRDRSPCSPRFEEGSQDETLHQERCARGVA